MEFDKLDLGIILTGLRCFETQTKYNNPKDIKTIMQIDILIKKIERIMGVEFVK